MICPSCKAGGQLDVTARTTKDDETRRILINRSNHRHDQCRGGTWCDCAHLIQARW